MGGMLGSDPADVMALDPAVVARWWHEACAEVPSEVQVVVGRRAKLKWEGLPEEHVLILQSAADIVLHRITTHLQQTALQRLQGRGQGAEEAEEAEKAASSPPYTADADPTPTPIPPPTPTPHRPRTNPMRVIVPAFILCCLLLLALFLLGVVAKSLALALLTAVAVVTVLAVLASRP
jgi:hypothetical protein